MGNHGSSFFCSCGSRIKINTEIARAHTGPQHQREVKGAGCRVVVVGLASLTLLGPPYDWCDWHRLL